MDYDPNSVFGMRYSSLGPTIFGINNNAGYLSSTFSEAMRINQSGNVGIGTTSPDQKLTVNGTIHSKGVRVDNSVPVPDYVFEKAYKPLDLPSLKAYLDANHHLPEIPSAAEIEKNGLNLGEINLKLLKKVEELTLYVIEKDSQLAQQNTLLTEEKKKNEKQEIRIAALEKVLAQLTSGK